MDLPIFNIRISAFKSALAVDPTTVNLGAFLNSKKFRDQVETVRKAQDKAIRDGLKKQLPAATISGVFSKRAANAIQEYNGLVCLDFDGKDNPGLYVDGMKQILSEINEVAYAAKSVGGAGVYAIIPTNNDDPSLHSRVVELFERLFAGLGLVVDKACKDVSRLRFISFDDTPIINPNPNVFDAKKYLQAQVQADSRKPRPIYTSEPKTAGDTTRKKVEQYIAAIESGCTDVTSTYDDWLRIGFALANAFGFDGEDLFVRVSQFNPSFDDAECRKKFNELRKNGRRVQIGTFFKICNDNGIHL